jgi:hypothetical protein
MYSKTISRMALVSLCLPTWTVFAALAEKRPSGAEVIQIAQARSNPLGYGALKVYEKIKARPFKENVQFSNQWIKGHIDYYDHKASPAYRDYVKDMIDGGGDVSLGMRGWLSDPKNVAWWDNTIRKLVNDDGYNRVVALNGAFAPGSDDYRIVYGGSRKFNAATSTLSINGTPRKTSAVAAGANESHDELFGRMVKRGDEVRRQMFDFYAAYAKGKVSAEQVKKFNESVIVAGGCALSATDAKETARSTRYLNAVNFMGTRMDSLGFPLKK